MNRETPVFIITGGQGQCKTTFLHLVLGLTGGLHVRVRGVLAPGHMRDGRRSGFTLVDLATGASSRNRTLAEYTAEGTGQPMLMLRDGGWKYTCCPGDPEQLFDLASDPDELLNRAAEPAQSARLEAFRSRAAAHWDVESVRAAVLDSQRRRRILSDALRRGRYRSWDWQPPRDAANEYVRSHLDLTELEVNSRWPRPAPFTPKWR